jgi:DNA-binding transcriptional ArsR family regulator
MVTAGAKQTLTHLVQCAMVNHMVQQADLDRTFAALADPTRRTMLERLGRGSATVSELAEPLGISLTGVKKHLHVLEEAGLVSTEKVGRSRHCRLGTERLDDAMAWISFYQRLWERRLDGLDAWFTLQKGTDR